MFDNRRSIEKLRLNIAGRFAATATLVAAFALASAAQQSGQQTFSSAAEASKALVSALQGEDEASLLKILGPAAKDIISSGDAAEDKEHREQFVQKYQRMHRLVNEPDGTTTLYIGAENWPTPIPLEQKNGAWYFDTGAGKQQILYRRIGRNELSAIQVCRELVDAEKEYYGQPHDGDSGQQYAQKFTSDAGKHNGLYWQASANGGDSPIGPLVASAAVDRSAGDHEPQPFMGYYFRILTAEKGAGGVHNFVVDGKMTGGFAFLAYPAEYRVSGVMSFVVDQDGIVYEKDLGPHTSESAKKLTRYDRNASWRKAD
jgi:hypothetical protein